MKINRENYPLFFLDYFEGSLPRAAEAELFDFLGMHPDLRNEFDAFAPVSLPSDEPVSFPDRESLKRGTITRHNYEWYFAAYIEGDLDTATHAAVDSFCAANPDMADQLALFQKTFLDGSDEITYSDKAALKREVVVPLPVIADTAKRSFVMTAFWQYASVAAVVLLMAGFFFLRTPDQWDRLSGNEQAQIHEKTVAMGEDVPEAVAEIPSPQRDAASLASQANESLAESSTPHTSRNIPATSSTPATSVAISNQTGSNLAISNLADSNLADSNLDDLNLDISSYERLPAGQTSGILTSMPPAIRTGQLAGLSKPDGIAYDHMGQLSSTALDYRTEFAYWTPQSLPDNLDEPAAYPVAAPVSTQQLLAQRGLDRIQQRSGVDFSQVEARIAENRFPLWELASLGITQLGTMAGNAIGLETRTDEDGQIVQLSLGERFEARRSR